MKRLLCLTTLTILPYAATAADWPQWRGPDRTGISAEKGWSTTWPTSGAKQLWKQPVGIGYSSMSVSQGRVYTMGNTDNVDAVWCFDAGTGKVLWKHAYPCSAEDPNGFKGTRCTPTVDGDRVYSVSRHGDLFCLDAATGKVKWAKNLVNDLGGKEPRHGKDLENQGWGYSGSPLIENDWVLVEAGGPGQASVVALDKQSGTVVWKSGSDVAGYASFVAFDLDGERCFLQFSGDHLILRRMKDGSELWRHPWTTAYGVNAATPIVNGNEVFISSAYGYGCALLRMTTTSVKEVWRNKSMKNHVNSCVLTGGYLYGFDESEIKCLDWKTGEVKWKDRSYGKGSLMLADGKLILFSQSGKLGVAPANPEEFKEIVSFKALEGENTWAAPVLANGQIYVRNLDTLMALDVKQ